MFSFLSAPAVTDNQVAQTAAGVNKGFEGGEREKADAADLARETQREKAAAELETSKANATALAKKVERLHAGSKEIYETTRGKISDTLSAYEKVMKAPGVSPNSEEYMAAATGYNTTKAHLADLDNGRAKYLSTAGDDAEQFDPNAANVPGAPPLLPLDAQHKAAQEGELESKAVGGPTAALHYQKLSKEVNSPAVKVPPHTAAAADEFSGGQSLLVPQAQRIRNLEKASAANPGDKVAESALVRARGEMQKTRDRTSASYQKTVIGIADGDYGDDVKNAYHGIVAALPAGTDPSRIENHGKIRAVLAAKEANGSLTPGEAKLQKKLRTDQDVSGAWGVSANPSSMGSPGDVLRAIQNEGVPLMGAPGGSPASTGVPALLPPPDYKDPLTGEGRF